MSERAPRFLLQSSPVPLASGPSAAWGRGPNTQTHTQDPACPLQHADHYNPGSFQSFRGPERTGEEGEHFGSKEGSEGDTFEEEPSCFKGKARLEQNVLLRVLGRAIRVLGEEERRPTKQAKLQRIRSQQDYHH